MRRLPTWLRFLIPVLLLALLAAAAVFRVMMDELPEYARPEAIQARYPEQLDLMRELAEAFPLDDCPDDEPAAGTLPLDSGSEHGRPPVELIEKIESLQVWQQQAEENAELFADRAIEGAEIVLFCPGGFTISMGMSSLLDKEGPQSGVPVSRALFETPTEWPTVSLWYHRSRRIVRYEDRLESATPPATGFRLFFDLEQLVPDSG